MSVIASLALKLLGQWFLKPAGDNQGRCVVVMPPAFHDDLGLLKRIEEFAVEQFAAELGIKALDVAFVGKSIPRINF